jgi:TPR repeat protein
LALAYENGHGAPRDVAAAPEWYRRAADGDDADALAAWKRLSAKPHCDEICVHIWECLDCA